MKELIKVKWKYVEQVFVKFVWKSFIAISVIISAGGTITDYTYFKDHPWPFVLSVLIVTIITTLIYVIHKLVINEVVSETTVDLPKEIERFVTILYKEKKFIDVVRFGSTISRYLWLSGFNKERIAIGKLVEDSASKTGRAYEQISALIDDIGWTYSVIGEHDKAKSNIVNGIKKAKVEQLFYLAAKGERHLAGVESKVGNKDKIIDHLNEALNLTGKINDKIDKNIMEASLLLAKSEFYYENKNYKDAETNAKSALAVYTNDLDRIVKVHSLLGNIYYAQNELQKAKDEFNQGYNKCKEFRKDEYAKNAVGLAKIEIASTNLKNSKSYLNEAKKIFEETDKRIELAEVMNLLDKINEA